MTEISLTFLNFLTEAPGNLVYHLVLIFTLSITIQAVLNKNNGKVSTTFKRILFSLVIVLLLQCLFFLAVIFTWQGMASQQLIIPPLDRVISTLSLIILLWAAIFTHEGRAADWISLVLCLAIIGLSIFSFTAWQVEYSQYNFNTSWLDWSWSILTAFVLIACILLVLTQKDKTRLPTLIFINLNLLGYLAQLLWGSDTADYSVFIRLAHLISFPLLPSLYLNRLENLRKENLISSGLLDLAGINQLFAEARKIHHSDDLRNFSKTLSETLLCHTVCLSKRDDKEIISLFLAENGNMSTSQEKPLDPNEKNIFLPLFSKNSVIPERTKAAADCLAFIEQTFSQKLKCRELFSLVIPVPGEIREGILILYENPLKKNGPEIIKLLEHLQMSIPNPEAESEKSQNNLDHDLKSLEQDTFAETLKEQLLAAESKVNLLEKRLAEKPDQIIPDDLQDFIELEKESKKIIGDLKQENQNAQKTNQRLSDEIGLYAQNIQQLQQEISDLHLLVRKLEQQKGTKPVPEQDQEAYTLRQLADIGTIIEQNIDKISLDLLEKNINLQLDLPEKLSGQISGKNELDQALQQLLITSRDLILSDGILKFKVAKFLSNELRDIISINIINEKIRTITGPEELSAIQKRLNQAERILKSIDANFEQIIYKETIQYFIQIPLIQKFPGLKQEHGNDN